MTFLLAAPGKPTPGKGASLGFSALQILISTPSTHSATGGPR